MDEENIQSQEENIQPQDLENYNAYTAPFSNYLVSTPSQINTPFTPAASYFTTAVFELPLNMATSDRDIEQYAYKIFDSDAFQYSNNERKVFNLTNNDLIVKKLPVPLSKRTIQKTIGDGTEVLLGEVFLPDSTFNNDCIAYVIWSPTSSFNDGIDLQTNMVSYGCRIIKQINVAFDGDSGFVEGTSGNAKGVNLPDMCIRYPESLWVLFRYTGQKDELQNYTIPVRDCFVEARIAFLSNVSVYDPIVSDGLN